MSFTTTSDLPACAPTSATSTLKLTDSTLPHSQNISMASLSAELSMQTMARLGSVDIESDAVAHSSCPPNFSGHLILVFWCDEPTVYSANLTRDGYSFAPANSGTIFNAAIPPILIDPRNIEVSRINFTTGAICSTSGPEATDGTSKTSHKGKSDGIQHSGLGGSGGDGGKGQKPSGDKGGEDSSNKGDKSGRTGRGYNRGITTAVDGLCELPPMVLTAVEFLTFFPHHTQWPTVLFRLYRNGWTTGSIAKLMLYARGNLDRTEWHRRQAALRHQLRTATINKYGHGSVPSDLRRTGHVDFQPFVPHSSGNNVDLYDVRNPLEPSGDVFQPPRGRNTHDEPATLQNVINGVVNWPTGQDAGQLTQALQYAQAHGLLQQTTRDLPNIVLQQGFVVQTDANTTQYDLRGVERLNNAVANP